MQLKQELKNTQDFPIIYIGLGTCGLGAGADRIQKAAERYLEQQAIQASIVSVGCVGLCSEEPLLDVKLPGKTRLSFSRITEEKVNALLEAIFNGEVPANHVLMQYRSDLDDPWENVIFQDQHPFFAPQLRLVLANCGVIDPGNINEYISLGGYSSLSKILKHTRPEELVDIVKKSGLRGRGGGGFSTGAKWEIAQKNDNEVKYLICNADEGDPGAYMDRAIIEGDPHRLIEGIILGAYGIGANKAYIYIRAEYPLAILRLEKAIIQAKDRGFLGESIIGSQFNLDVSIKMGAGAFVCGEETALISSIEGKRGEPRPRPPYPANNGVFNCPTIINNVETLANLPTIIEKGADWFSSIGTDFSKGSKVFALSGKINNSGLVEVAMGTSIRTIIYAIGKGLPNGKRLKGVQMGGPSGGCVPESQLDMEVDFDSLKTVGAMMGSGGMVVLDEDTCMVDLARFFMEFIQKESCGKCVPCRIGTRRMLDVLEAICQGTFQLVAGTSGTAYLEKLAQVGAEASLCGLGKSASNPVVSTLRWFRDEYDAHIHKKQCPAGVCKSLIIYEIAADKCNSCGLCKKQCVPGAIVGGKKTPYFIDQAKCIKCGFCKVICPENAI